MQVKISGIKHHIALDSNGFPIIVTRANIQNGTLALFSEHINSLDNLQIVLQGYLGNKFAQAEIFQLKLPKETSCILFMLFRWGVHSQKIPKANNEN